MERKLLFITFLIVFAATAAITLLGIIEFIPIKAEFLSKLFYTLIIESIAPVIMLFQKTFISNNQLKVEAPILVHEKVPNMVLKRLLGGMMKLKAAIQN